MNESAVVVQFFFCVPQTYHGT